MQPDEGLIKELERATEGLFFMSESDYPFEIIRWTAPGEVTHEFLRRLTGQPEDARIEVRTVDDFFRAAVAESEWKEAQELATARKYQALVDLLKENLKEIKVYRVGEINIPVYIVGRSVNGNWIGLATRVVET